MAEYKLPKEDEFGNYWFGNKYDDPAIFPVKSQKTMGRYFLSFGGDKGVAFHGEFLIEFESAHEALDYLNRVFRKR